MRGDGKIPRNDGELHILGEAAPWQRPAQVPHPLDNGAWSPPSGLPFRARGGGEAVGQSVAGIVVGVEGSVTVEAKAGQARPCSSHWIFLDLSCILLDTGAPNRRPSKPPPTPELLTRFSGNGQCLLSGMAYAAGDRVPEVAEQR